MLLLLNRVCLAPGCDDQAIWTPNKSGAFSVQSFCHELATAASPLQHSALKGVWRGLVPHCIEIFTWIALLEKLNTMDKLCRIGIIPQSESICSLCGTQQETCNHLFLHCDVARSLWVWWLSIWELNWVFPFTLKECFVQWKYWAVNPFFKKVWFASFFIILWSLWKERNSKIFQNSSMSIQQLQNLVLLRLSWWIKGWGDPFPYSSEDIIRNPSCLLWVASDGMVGLNRPPKVIVSWNPPIPGHLKWNVDASFKPSPRMSAIGGVLRGSCGLFKCMFSSPIPPIEINSAEVLAIYRALQITASNATIKSQPILVESDSVNAVKWCNDDTGGPWNLNFQLNYIRNARKEWLNLSITHRGRSANMVADSLAKQGLVRDAEFIAWL